MEIEHIRVPGPDQVGKANIYLIRGEENILIDTGPRKKETFLALKDELSDLGLGVEDIDQVLLTHPHSDHFGNASKIKEISGAKVAIHREAVSIVEEYGEHIEQQSRRAERYFVKNGVPEEENTDLFRRAIPEVGDVSVEIDQRLEDDDLIETGENCIKVIYTPGHTPGSATFISRDEGIAFIGDTVLSDITPNPMLHFEENRVYHSLKNYLDSLRKLRELEPEKLYPGHGEVIEEPGERIDEIMEHHLERKENVLEIVEEKRTAFEVMKELFPSLKAEYYLFGMSEAVGHLELLVSEGKVEKLEEEKIFYRAY